MVRAGASTRFTSTSTSRSTCNMCKYEYESEYLIIAWVRVRVLVDEYEYQHVIYILYKEQYCIFQSLKRESSDSYKPETKLCPCKFPLSILVYICLTILCNLVQWHFTSHIATYWLSWLTITTCCQFKNRKQKLRNIRKYVENSLFF